MIANFLNSPLPSLPVAKFMYEEEGYVFVVFLLGFFTFSPVYEHAYCWEGEVEGRVWRCRIDSD